MTEQNHRWTDAQINAAARAPAFAARCSADYRGAVAEAADRLFFRENKTILMLAGPSASGKTTTAKLLASRAAAQGRRAHVISMDDFYRSKTVPGYPRDAHGEPDFDRPESLDLPLLGQCLAQLLAGEACALPRYDFAAGLRLPETVRLQLGESDLLIVEGLHALLPAVTEALPPDRVGRVFVSVASSVYDLQGRMLLSSRTLRFLRRLVRDARDRSITPERTFAGWQTVMRGEDRYLFPLRPFADVQLDSFHPCEPCILASQAIRLLSEVQAPRYSSNAAQLCETLRRFRPADPALLPPAALLHEFTGEGV
ncbi:MAG: nucleoside kinase [Clostridia bacterium]|nr:nucleoside kinase [Clostridia bacterium]